MYSLAVHAQRSMYSKVSRLGYVLYVWGQYSSQLQIDEFALPFLCSVVTTVIIAETRVEQFKKKMDGCSHDFSG